MSPQAVDYSFSRPNPHDLAAAGYVGAMRYLSNPPNAKIITADEVASLHANNLAIGFVWESVEQRAAKSGYDGGKQDAQRAIAMLQALGAPAGTAIYYVLEDPTRVARAEWTAVFAYAQGVYEVGGPYRRGGYGSQALLEEARSRGWIELLWQVGGWSTGPSAVGHLLQRTDSAANPPPGCDVNDILADDWGQWPLTQGADDMALSDEDKAFITQTVADQVTKIIHDSGVNGAADPRVNGANTVLDALANVAKQVAQPAGSTTLHGDVPLSGTLHFG